MASDRQPNQAPPDPDPTLTPGLAPGGGTEPGDTPSDSGQESATSNPDPTPPAGGPKKLIAPTVVIAIYVLVFLTIAILFILKLVGVFN